MLPFRQAELSEARGFSQSDQPSHRKPYPDGRKTVVMHRNLFTRTATAALILIISASLRAQNIITTVAGGGNPTSVAPTLAPVGQPWAIVEDGSGNMYVSDTHSNRVYEITAGGSPTISVVAGMTTDGLSGNQGTPSAAAATSSSLSFPQGLAFLNGALYIADDGNNQIRVVNTNAAGGATITIYPGAGANAISIPPGDIADVAGLPGGAACNVNAPGSSTCLDGNFATAAPLNAPAGIFVDASGDIFIADTNDHVVREINGSTGVINAVAGKYSACTSTTSGCGDGSPATSAQLNLPNAVVGDTATPPNLYIADTGDNVVRVVNTQATTITINGVPIGSGDIATVVGTYSACTTASCGDTGSATLASLTGPAGVFLDSSGNLYIADTGDQVVREVSGGTINLIAGTYFASCSPFNTVFSPAIGCGDSSSSGSAILAQLFGPTGVYVDGSSNIFIADEFVGAIREVTAGTISTFAGEHFNYGYYGDGATAVGAEIQEPTGVAIDSSGNLYVADTSNNLIRKVDATTGNISTVAGNGTPQCHPSTETNCGDGGAATLANFTHPSDVFVDAAGTIYIADAGDNVIRAVNTTAATIKVANVSIPAGAIQTIGGEDFNLSPGYGGDGGQATLAAFNNPSGLFVDSSGNIYIADTGNNVIRKITPGGTISTVAGTCPSFPCTGSYSGDGGAAIDAHLNNPAGVFVDAVGNIYIVDGGTPAGSNNVIREVNASTLKISTIAGNGTKCSVGTNCGDGGLATAAQLSSPWGAFVDYAGNLFISDQQDQAIRVVNMTTSSETLAGVTIGPGEINSLIGYGPINAGVLSNPGFTGDGGAATSALVHGPMGIRADSSGNLYFVDHFNWRIRKVASVVGTKPTATPSPSSLSFSSTEVGETSAAKTVVITNSANLSSLNYVISFTGTNPTDFSESDTCSGKVAAGKTCTLDVMFKPSAVGSRSANLLISDSLAGTSQTVPLTGTSGQGTTSTTVKSSATSSSFGQSVTFTATVVPDGGTPTGSVTFKDGTTSLGSAVTISSAGVATFASSTLSVGTHTITAVYGGDSNFTGSTSSAVSQVVSQATTTTTLKSSANPSDAGQSVTFTATVAPTTSGTPTGTVTFEDAGKALGSAVTIKSGVATFATATLATGTDSITAVYSGDANFKGSTSSGVSEIINVPAFTVPKAGTLSPASVTAGSSATATITVTSVNNFAAAVALSCSVSPSPSDAPTCAFNPSTITPKANASVTSTLTVSTTAASSSSALERRSNVFFAMWLLLPAMLLSSSGLSTPNRRKFLSCILLFLALGGSIFLVACGGGGSTTTTPPSGGTPSGAYVITVTATSGSSTQTQTLNFTVQ
jgi:trimeric autotransporter adhesin